MSGFPEGPQCGQLQWMLHSSKKSSRCWRGKGGTKNKTENYAGTTKRHRQGHTGPALHTGPGRMTNGHVPLFHPWIEGES